ncbi:MAG: hypothetical protein M4D80_28550 [Myxococcota bacterium]|nr:hypothetical protein [Myxococcota bacterium]
MVLLVGCVNDGEMGDRGPAGPEGPAGSAGGGLVWANAAGAVVDNAVVGFQETSFAMKIIDGTGVFFTFDPLTASPVFRAYNSSSLTRFFLAPGCVGPVHVAIATVPKVAFKYDGRTVAMPADVEIATTVGSFASSSGCTATSSTGSFVKVTALEMLPTLAPPVLGTGPFHVTRM